MVQIWFLSRCIFKLPKAFACSSTEHLPGFHHKETFVIKIMALQPPSQSAEDRTCWRIAYYLILLTLTPNHPSLNGLFSKGEWREVTCYHTTAKTNHQRGWQPEESPSWSYRCGINLYIHPTKWEDTGKWDVTGEIKKWFLPKVQTESRNCQRNLLQSRAGISKC